MSGQLTPEQYDEIKAAITDIAGVKADMAIIAAMFPQLKKEYGEVVESIKEVHDMRVEMAEIKVAIKGNGTKGLADRVGDLEKCPPKFSWKQVVANTILIVTIVTAVCAFIFFSLEDFGDSIKRLEETLITHITTTIH